MADGNEQFEGANKRPRRSRSSASGDSGEPITAVDPADIGSGNSDAGSGPGDDFERDGDGNPVLNADGSPRRKRGRKSGGGSGSRTRRSKTARPYDLKASVDTLSNILSVLHEGIAVVGRVPEMSLDKAEADLLAKATVPVLEQFNITPDPRFAAAFGLIAACGTVYVPRAYLIRARMAAEAQARADSRMRNVTPTATPQPATATPGPTVFDGNDFLGGSPN